VDGLLREDERARVSDDALGDAIGLAVNRAIADAQRDTDACPFCNADTPPFCDDNPSAVTDY
jgi:hypothetical protein